MASTKSFKRRPRVSHLFFIDDLLLFAEARDDQIDCIKEGLDLFYNASGQHINFFKVTNVFLSIHLRTRS